MSNTFKKVVSITTSATTILWLSGVAALAPVSALAAVGSILDGDTIKTADNPDVYIAKYVGTKQFKRLILNPDVFNSYGHLSWSKIKTATQAEMDAFVTSELVKGENDPKVYKLVPNGDVGTRQWLNMTAEKFVSLGYDWDAIYQINNKDRDNYTGGTDITDTPATTTASPTPTTSAAAGTLTIALASDTPSANIAPLKAARVPFTKIGFTAGASDVTITAITAQRTGVSADAALSSIALIDNATNLQVGLNQTLNSSHQVTFRDTITIPANTTKYYTLSANMPSTTQSQAGNVASLSLTDVTTTATKVGTLPLTGNGQTINEALVIGSVSGTTGSLNVSTSTKAVGTTAFNFSGIKLTAGSTEDVTVSSIRFNQSGSAAAGDLANVVVSDGTTDYATTVSSDGKYYTASFGTAGLSIGRGLSKEFTVKGDIASGSARTISFDIYRSTDIAVKGDLYKYYLTLDANTSFPFNTASNPIFNGNDITIGTGSLRVDKSSTGAPAANITKGSTGALLGAFDFVVQGEPVNVASMIMVLDMSGATASSTDLTNITLTKADGSVLLGPVDGSATNSASDPDGTATFSGTVTFPVGTTQVLVKGTISTDPANNATVAVSFQTPATKVTSATGGTTGNTVTATPASNVIANTMTIKAGALTVSVSGTPVSQTVIRGITGFTFANYLVDASASGENVKVTTIALQDTMGAAGTGLDLTNLVLYDGDTALNTGSNVVNPAAGTAGAANSHTFTLDVPLVVTKGTQKTVALKGNISGNATAGSTNTHQWGLASGATVTANGVSTTLTVSATVNNADGSTMTIASAGQYSAVLDSSTPTGKLIAANTTGNIMTVLKFKATSETINITKIRLSSNNASSTGNDLSQVYIYDGGNLLAKGTLGIGNATGKTANASSTFTVCTGTAAGVSCGTASDGTLLYPLVVKPGTDKLVTIKADVATIDTINTTATAGHQIAIDYYGSTDSTENAGSGASSGSSISGYSGTTAQTAAFIYRSVPTVAAVTLPNSTLSNSTMVINKFSVSADAKGDIDLYRFSFDISTTNPTTGGPITLQNLTLVDVTSSAEVTLYASTTQVYSPVIAAINLLASPGTYTGATTTRTVSAGTTRTFELRGTIGGTGAGAAINTDLRGDAAAPVAMSAGMVTRDQATADAQNDFIWSDLSDTDHTSTGFGATVTDYTNGYLVSGLPSSYVAQQVLSK